MIVGVELRPVDTLFLRGGTPFAAGETPQEDVRSLFPPNPPTVVGAMRAALARCNGWSGRGRWPERLDAVLGNGPHLGSLASCGPFVLRKGRPLFPSPRHLLGPAETDGWRAVAFLRPGAEAACDLGPAVRLPEFPRRTSEERLKPARDRWLTRTGLQSLLRGELPEAGEILARRDLWREEERIGLEVDRGIRTAREGRLFSTRHIRLGRRVSLGMSIRGLPGDWTLPHGRLVPLGGESRVAEFSRWDAVELGIDVPSRAIESSGRLAVVALTPLDLDEAVAAGREPLEAECGLRVVSACLDRPFPVGGWDSLGRRPLPLRSLLPAGSTLFCEADDPRRLLRAVGAGAGLIKVGRRTDWGFGVATVGVWPEETEGK